MRRCTRGSIDDQASSISTTSTHSTATMESPDNDSAFDSDDVSLMSSESSASSGSGMISGGARWVRQAEPPPTSQDADGRKFFVNIYCADGSTKEAILIDGQMTVSTVIWLMSERSHVQCHAKWGLVEHIPELNIERCLEDHEKLFDTLLQWKAKSENRIVFAQRPEKYDVFHRPERYLPNCETIPGLMDEGRQALLTAFFSSDVCKSAQSDGLLWTKTEGKKSWKKHLFVLRDGNLFQATKCKKGATQDFVLVANIKFCRVYWGVNWKKKLKAPNEFSFALTPPKLHQQEKGNACMKYLCAEDEATRHKWTTLFRVAQTGRQLVENYSQLSGKPNFLPPREMKEVKPVLTINNGANNIDWQQRQSNGVPPPNVIGSWQHEMMSSANGGQPLLHRSDSEMSSCCMSEVDSSSSSAISATSTAVSENGFDTDHHEQGGTIRRKPVGASNMSCAILSANAATEPPPPPSPSVLPCPSLAPSLAQQIPPLHPDQQQLFQRQLGDVPRQLTESDLSLNSLPPPPEELRHLNRLHSLSVAAVATSACEHHIQQTPMPLEHPSSTQIPVNGNIQQQQQPVVTAIREELYPCGVPRVLFHPGNPGSGSNGNGIDQMDLLKMLPNNPPPRPFTVPIIMRETATPDLKSLLKAPPTTLTTAGPPTTLQPVTQASARRRRITFNELVHSVDDDDETDYHPLKCDDVTPTPEDCQETYSERDVSNWVLQSLKHCRVGDAPNGDVIPTVPPVSVPIISHELRPKIYNGRSVPNCFPPGEEEATRPVQLLSSIIQPQMCTGIDPRGRRIGPPPPPKRSQHTQLTSPT